MNQDKQLVSFNIQNAAYAVPKSGGAGWENFVKFVSGSDSLALDANYSEKVIYSDGLVRATIPNDKGKTGTLTLLNIDNDYEIAMGRRMKTANGTSEIKQRKSVEHVLYYEFEYLDENTGATKVAKVQLYGVTSGRPSQALNQTTDDINNNNVDLSLTIKGMTMKANTGDTDYTDANGNIVKVWQTICLPGEEGYDTFGETVVVPKAPTA